MDVEEAERIVSGEPAPEDAWAEDYPFEGDVVAVGAFLLGVAAVGDQRPYGYYRITRLTDGLAIGGIGFKGRPLDGSVEIGYGLVPSARGLRYAAEAVAGLLGLAVQLGVREVTAETDPGNVASQRTLTRAGFELVRADDELHLYRVLLPGRR